MRVRTLILFAVAILLAGGTAMLARSWLAQQRTVEAEAAPMPPPPAQRSVLVARSAIPRGQILQPVDLAWRPWPETSIDPAYIREGSKPIEALTKDWVARDRFAPGEPITEAKTVARGDRSALAAMLRAGMRAVSVPVTATSDVSGLVHQGDHVDVLVTHSLPAVADKGDPAQYKASETVLRDVQVLAVDDKLDSKPGETGVPHNVTLEVTPKQSQTLAVAGDMGKLSLSLRSLASSPVEEINADSSGAADSGSFTLDSEISRLVPKPFIQKDNLDAYAISILRGNGKSETVSGTQPASRGL
jgi:pilus assembly protein CpaB